MISNFSDNPKETIFSTEISQIIKDLHSADLGRIDLAIERLRAMDHATTIRQITRVVNYPDPENRCRAIELLLLINASETLEFVLPLLKDPIGFVRYNLLLSLYDTACRDRRLVDPLIGILAQDEDANVRSMAALLLGKIRDEKAIPALQLAISQDFSTDYEGETVSSIAAKVLASLTSRSNDQATPIS
jgi:HEAT repeat protein